MKKVSLVSLLAVGLTVVAQGSSPLGNASTFNAFIFGSATLSGGGESEGAIAVGGIGATGNVFSTNSNYNTTIKSGTAATAGTLTDVGLYVNGSANFSAGGQLNNGTNAYVSGNFATGNPYDLNGGGNLYYGGTKSGTIQGGSAVNQSGLVSSSFFTSGKSYAESLDTKLTALSPNATVNTNVANNWSVTYTGGVKANTTYVVDLSAASLAGYGGNAVTLSLNGLLASDTLIFDVSGGAVSNFGVSVTNGFSGYQNRILWNFENSTSVTINNRPLEGSVLAPYATVNQSTVIEGTLIADNWKMTNGVEIHSYNFTGSVPAATPEPAPFAALGLGALLVIRRRKKA